MIVSSVVQILKNTACKSVAVTVPTVAPSSTTNVADEVNTGAQVSATITVLVAVPVFPAASVALCNYICALHRGINSSREVTVMS